MGKNDVEIQIRAKDAVGPGIDSARRSFAQFQRDMERSGGMASLTAGAIKFGAAVNGIKAGFDIAAAGVHLFKGNTEAALDAIQRLPLGVGAIIGSMREFSKSLDEPNAKVKAMEEHIERLRSVSSLRIQAITELDRRGESKIDATERKNIEAAEKERAELIGAAFKAAKGRSDTERFQREKEEIEKLFQLRVNVARNEAAFDREAAASEERIRKASQERMLKDQEIFTTRSNLIREQEQFGTAYNADGTRWNGTGPRYDAQGFRLKFNMATPMRFGEGSNVGDLDRDAMARLRRGSGGGLPSGASDRFGTGLVAAAQDRMQTEAARQTKLAEEQVELLKKIVEGRDTPANQIILNGGGIFGGLS